MAGLFIALPRYTSLYSNKSIVKTNILLLSCTIVYVRLAQAHPKIYLLFFQTIQCTVMYNVILLMAILGSQAGSVPSAELVKPSFPLEEVLRRGQVPPRVRYQVDRTELVEKAREELYKLKDSDGWVLIHGAGGFGKTTLAAESVRSAPLLQDVFPDGVFWLSLKKMTSGGEVDKSKLLEKLQNLILRVDNNSKNLPSNIEAATDHLKKVMQEQHPRSLLILDDIWESKVANVFSGHVRVLVTSRNADVANEVCTPFLYPVPIPEGLSDEEARLLLSKVTKTPPDSLPEEAKYIIQYCMGSPLALGIIAAKLSPNTLSKWKAIVRQLKSKSQAHDVRKRMNASVGLSIEELSEESKERFHSLVVFANSAVISACVLCTFWGMDEVCDAELIMEGELLSVHVMCMYM